MMSNFWATVVYFGLENRFQICYEIYIIFFTLILTPFILVESDSEGNPVVGIVPKEPAAKSGSSSSSSSSSDTESLHNADANSRNGQILCQTSLGETISDSLSKAVVVEVPKPLPETPTPVDKSSSEDESHQQETEMNISQEVSEPIIVVQAESEKNCEKAMSISSKKSSSSSSSESGFKSSMCTVIWIIE